MNHGAAIIGTSAPRRSVTWLEHRLRTQVHARLGGLRDGWLIIEDPVGVSEFGDRGATLKARILVNDAALYRALVTRGSVGAAESYLAGHWEADDLLALDRILVRNRDLLDGFEGGVARIAGALLRLGYHLRRNTLGGSRRNIAAHYDLGNEFFALFLSPDLMYSSALWEEPDETLEQASQRKLERIGTLLALQSTDHVIEIGSGWGGFAVFAAARYGCRVTTTTISAEQYGLAQQRVARAGLADRVTVLLKDYRELQGQYDKLVSIEMIEAVGAQFLPGYFGQLSQLLKPGGHALLQAITIEDHRYAQALRSVDFIKQYIFPGSFIPSINAMLEAKSAASDLALIRLEDFGLSYARTLAAWRQAFLASLDAVRRLGFDERFIRLWEFYLTYCESGFRERSIGVSHLLFARPGQRGGT
jgi:cyclopropane-fatty-acyl-phospholipid synthase